MVVPVPLETLPRALMRRVGIVSVYRFGEVIINSSSIQFVKPTISTVNEMN